MTEHAHESGQAFGEDFFGKEFWDERYRSSDRVWSGQPNPQLVAEVSGRPPGRALDAGCGEGADALWLARNGWTVVATDISSVALERAARHARKADPDAAGRIDWRQADLLAGPPERAAFDLASAQFIQLPPAQRVQLLTGLIESLRAGGMLLVVGHHPSDLSTGVPRPPMPDRFYTADEIAALLDETWTVEVSESRPRPATTPDGTAVTIHDTVLAATRQAAG
jgi:SAM-dependent methyltransferase